MSYGFTLKDKSHLINLNGKIADFKIGEQFLSGWPQEIQELGLRIITELHLRNFDVPGCRRCQG